MTPSGWRVQIRRQGRRMWRRLGLPRVSGRSALLIFLLFVGLAYLSVTVLTDFFATLGRYTPQYYEPKDSARQ